jgi:hypothetical protein
MGYLEAVKKNRTIPFRPLDKRELATARSFWNIPGMHPDEGSTRNIAFILGCSEARVYNDLDRVKS